MIKFNRTLQVVLLSAALAFSGSACSTDRAGESDWPVGTWVKTIDEDNGPPDSVTFRSDGTFATYDKQCRVHTNAYFVEKGMIFLIIPLKKGPVALIFRPNADKSSMSFTSPRTQNNAVYVPSGAPHCRPEG